MGEMMKSIYMPSESFQSNQEVNILNKFFASSYKSLLDDIDDKIEVWIIGNKDKDFFNKLNALRFIIGSF